MKKLFISVLAFYSMGLIAESGSFVIQDVRLFDGENVHQNVNVIIKDGRIDSIQTNSRKTDLPIIDGSDSTLMPGLLDAHTHTELVQQLVESLRFGVTTVFDVGTFPEDEHALRVAAANRNDVADFRSSGIFITAPGGHGTEYEKTNPPIAELDEVDDFVENIVEQGADYLKIVLNGVRHENNGTPTLEEDMVRALIKAGHKHNKLVVAHVESGEDTRVAVESGVDGLVHHWRDGGARPDLAELIVRHDVFVMPTPTALDGILRIGPDLMLTDPLIVPYLSELSRRQLTKSLPFTANIEAMKETNAGIKSLIDADVLILAGTDAFNGNPRIVHGASMHRLLVLFVEAGLTPLASLQSATANVADAYQITDRGRIKPGLRADLLLVNGDPTQNIRATRDIRRVWRGGDEIINRE
jgi:imidazolonepropionase-like amidohydrolase